MLGTLSQPPEADPHGQGKANGGKFGAAKWPGSQAEEFVVPETVERHRNGGQTGQSLP